MRTIYVDELFLLNGIINYLLLLVTKRIIRARASQPRLLLSSMIGALYAVFMFLPHNAMFYSFFGKFLFSLAIVGITYKIKKIKQYLRAVGVFYMVSFAFGGAAYGLMSMLGKSGVSYLPLKILATSTVAAYAGIVMLSSYYKRLSLKERRFADMEITICGQTVPVTGYLDTGNCLYEPISDSPVVVVEISAVISILPPELPRMLSAENACLPTEFKRRIRLIPYNSVGKSGGVIIGVKPDRVVIKGKIIYDVIIGLCENKLSADDSYSALINPQILGGTA